MRVSISDGNSNPFMSPFKGTLISQLTLINASIKTIQDFSKASDSFALLSGSYYHKRVLKGSRLIRVCVHSEKRTFNHPRTLLRDFSQVWDPLGKELVCYISGHTFLLHPHCQGLISIQWEVQERTAWLVFPLALALSPPRGVAWWGRETPHLSRTRCLGNSLSLHFLYRLVAHFEIFTGHHAENTSFPRVGNAAAAYQETGDMGLFQHRLTSFRWNFWNDWLHGPHTWLKGPVRAAFGRRNLDSSSMLVLWRGTHFYTFLIVLMLGDISREVRGPRPLDKNVEHNKRIKITACQSLEGSLKMPWSTGPSMLESLVAPDSVLLAPARHPLLSMSTHPLFEFSSFLYTLLLGSCPSTRPKHQQNPFSDWQLYRSWSHHHPPQSPSNIPKLQKSPCAVPWPAV